MNIISREEAIKLNLGYYFTGEPCRRGHYSERYTPGRGCVECRRLYERSPEGRSLIKKARHSYARRTRKNDPWKWMLRKVKVSAKQRDILFDIPRDYKLELPTHCPLLGIELNYNNHIPLANSASIDRIDSHKGYSKDNIRIISNRANKLKNDATIEEFKLILQNWDAK